MTNAEYVLASAIKDNIKFLEEHISSLEDAKTRELEVTVVTDSGYGDYPVKLQPDFLPITTEDLYALYILKVRNKIKTLELEFYGL